MPLGSFRVHRGRLAFHQHAGALGCLLLEAALGLSCSAPKGDDLFQPLPGGGTGGSNAGTGGSAGNGGSSAGGSGGSGGAAGSAGAGSGGSGPGAGAAGRAGGAPFEGDASIGDAGGGDSGVPDAGPTPPVCVASGAEVCDGLDNDCDGDVDPGDTCPEQCRGFALAEHGYMFCGESVDRGLSLARCEAQNMKLVWIESAEENAALVAAVSALDVTSDQEELLTQIGASDEDDEDEWRWIGNGASPDGFQFWEGTTVDDDGEPVDGSFANWSLTEPNDQDGEDCGVISILGSENRDSGQWDDRSCDVTLPFLCEEP